MKFKNKCPECGGGNLAWDQTSRNASGVVEGRLRTSDVSVVFFLGCNECSATVQVVSSESIVAHLNGQMSRPEKVAIHEA